MSTLNLDGHATPPRSGAERWRAGILSCKPKQPAAAAGLCSASSCKTDVRTSALWQGVKATAPKGFEPRPVGAEPVSIEDAPSVRSTDARTPPDLLNTPKGLSMAKTACVSLQTALKFVPVHDLMKPAQISQTVACRPLNRRFYTLCEVGNGDRQFLPPLEPASSRRQNRPVSGSSADLAFWSL